MNALRQIRARFRLLGNARAVLKHAWSVRLGIAAVLLTGAEGAFALAGHRLFPDEVWRALVLFVLTSAALGARFIVQQKLRGPE